MSFSQVLIDGSKKKKGKVRLYSWKTRVSSDSALGKHSQRLFHLPPGLGAGCTPQPMTGSPCAAQTVLKEGPSPEARRPSGTTCCVSLHVRCSLITGASELRRRSQGNSGKSEALRVQHMWASALPCHPETCYEGLGKGRPPGESAGPGWGVRSWARSVASLSLGGHVLNLCDGIASQGC